MRHRFARVCLLLTLLGATAHAAQAPAASEYSVKAGYLLLFTRYVEWPSTSFASASAPIVVCVLGDDPFGSTLDRTFEGQSSQNRSLSVRRVSAAQQAGECHIAFIAASEHRNQQRWLDELSRRPVLTVAEGSTAFAHGAVIGFVAERGRRQARIRFEVSYPAMQHANLKISSPMLVAARKVYRDKPSSDGA